MGAGDDPDEKNPECVWAPGILFNVFIRRSHAGISRRNYSSEQQAFASSPQHSFEARSRFIRPHRFLPSQHSEAASLHVAHSSAAASSPSEQQASDSSPQHAFAARMRFIKPHRFLPSQHSASAPEHVAHSSVAAPSAAGSSPSEQHASASSPQHAFAARIRFIKPTLFFPSQHSASASVHVAHSSAAASSQHALAFLPSRPASAEDKINVPNNITATNAIFITRKIFISLHSKGGSTQLQSLFSYYA